MAISVSYLSLVRRVATSVVLLVLSLIAGQIEARAQSSDARLTPDERQRLVVAHEKVKTNPAVHLLETQLENFLRQTMLAADPSLDPVLFKIKGSVLEEIKAARDPENRAVEALSKATEAFALRDQQQAEAEMNRQHYEATAKKLIEINPDQKDAESKVYELKSYAGQHLDSDQMRQLFSLIDRRLELNHERRVKILKETGYDELKYDFDLIDWKKTHAAAKEFAAKNSAIENEKPPEEKPEHAPVDPNEIAPPIPPRSSVVDRSPMLLGVAVVALLTAVWFLYRRKPYQRGVQATGEAGLSNEAWFFADCPRCEWRHSQPDGILDPETGVKCASCGGVFEPKWRQEEEP